MSISQSLFIPSLALPSSAVLLSSSLSSSRPCGAHENLTPGRCVSLPRRPPHCAARRAAWRDWTQWLGVQGLCPSASVALQHRPHGACGPGLTLRCWAAPSAPPCSGSGPLHTYSYRLMGLVSHISQIIKGSAPSGKGEPAGSETCHHPCHLPSSHCLSDLSP